MSDVLLVEDDPDLRLALDVTLRREKLSVTPVGSAEDALAALARQDFRIVVSDIRMPGMDGLELVARIREQMTDMPVVLMTAHADTRIAVQALRGGARDLLIKPFPADSLIDVVRRHLPVAGVADEGADLVATDPVMRAVVSRAERVARADATVLLTGESGVGKEVLARHIHARSLRAAAPFVAINCAAIPETLLESTLFGHEKGAFSGATRQQIGKFELASGGTLLLDEIGEMPQELQAKLLRVLQQRVVERVGGTAPVPVDFRLIAATNRDLLAAVREGRFREDLYFRLAVIPVAIPPLRERPLDIVPLARVFLARYRSTLGPPDARLSEAAEHALRAHPWRGNVRELENAIQRALLLADGPEITPAELELEPGQQPEVTAPVAALAETRPATIPPGTVREAPAAGGMATSRDVRVVERDHILSVLRSVGGSRREAIAILGISERALRYKLKAYREQGFAPDLIGKSQTP